jgi:hypothetical protein
MARKKQVPSGMPAVPEAQGSERERLSMWLKTRIEELDKIHQERIEILRTIGEHPSPIFAAQVREHALLGLDVKHIAVLLHIPINTIRDHYAEELLVGDAMVISEVAKNMLRIATSESDPNNAKVGMEVLARRGAAKWKPAAQKLITQEEKPDGGKVFDASKFTREEREQLRAMIERVDSGGEGDPLEAPIIE